MKTIPLTQGKEALVDDEDYEYLMQWKWCAAFSNNVCYAKRNGGQYGYIKMHCQIMGRVGIDHRDGNGLNNQRSNLRVANKSQNAANSKKREGTSSVFKGVSYDKQRNKWFAYIGHEGKLIHLGRHTTEIAAAKAYNKAATEYFGEFARLNPV